MRDERTDRRPRILDFSTRIEGVRLMRDLGWPCHAYRVTIPIRPSGRLNLFEETILRLLDNARLDEGALADTTCLDVSLIKLVCCRLRDLGMITEHNEVDALGRTHLSRSEEEPLEYEVRVVFRDRISGSLLPVIYDGELRYEELAEWNEHRAEIRKTTKKGTRSVHLRLLHGRGSSDYPRPPAPSDVLWVTNRHKELSRQYSVLRRGVVPCPHIVHANQMNVDPNPESVFLRCRVVVPAGGDDYRIGDPFGYGYSESLRRSYEGVRAVDPDEQEFIRQMREKSLTVRPRSPNAHADFRDAEMAVLSRLADGVSDYSDLFGKLKQAEREFRRSSQPPRNTDEEAHFAYQCQQAAQSLAEALEVALSQVAAKSRPAACEAILCGRGQTHQDNGQLLEKLAGGLGLHTSGLGGLLLVPPGRIRGLRDGVVDLQALLAVTMAAGSEDKEHPLRLLAASFPDWLLFLRELKTMRDASAHGDSRAAGSKRLEDLREGAYRSIEVLLPGLQRDVPRMRPEETRPGKERVHDARRQAITRLEDHFGVQWYAGIDTNGAELLIQVELASASLVLGSKEPVNAVRTINDLSSLMQSLVHARQSATGQELGNTESPIEIARRRAVEAGLLSRDAELPPVLAKVNPRRLEEALRGRSPTLGASLMALLILSPLEWLRGLAVASSGFLHLVAQLIELRGHGNRPVFMPAEDLVKLKDEIYTACSTLMEA